LRDTVRAITTSGFVGLTLTAAITSSLCDLPSLTPVQVPSSLCVIARCFTARQGDLCGTDTQDVQLFGARLSGDAPDRVSVPDHVHQPDGFFLKSALSCSHLASIHLKAMRRGFCRIGMSCAIRRRPRGSIQRPKIGRKLKTPPRMSNPATTTRTQNEDGSRSHRMKADTFVGTRRRSNSKYLSNSALTEAINSIFSLSGCRNPPNKRLNRD